MIAFSHSCAKQHHWDSIVLLKLLQFQCQINWKHFNEFPVVLSPAIMISLSWPDTGHWICSNVADNQCSLLHHSVTDQWGVWVNRDLNQSQGEKVSTLVADNKRMMQHNTTLRKDSMALKYEILCHPCHLNTGECIVLSDVRVMPQDWSLPKIPAISSVSCCLSAACGARLIIS